MVVPHPLKYISLKRLQIAQDRLTELAAPWPTQSTSTALLQCHYPAETQLQSLIFRLPREIRTMIYSYALPAYQDSSRPLQPDDCSRRPGHTCEQHVSLDLIRSCQRIYREAWSVAIEATTHLVYLPPLNQGTDLPDGSMSAFEWKPAMVRSLQILQRRHLYGREAVAISHINVIADPSQLFLLSRLLELPRCNILRLTITVRAIDWCDNSPSMALELTKPYERENYLMLARIPTHLPVSLQSFRMELEVPARRSDQLDEMLTKMRSTWTFKRADGVLFVPGEDPVAEYSWVGGSKDRPAWWVDPESDPNAVEYRVVITEFIPTTKPKSNKRRRRGWTPPGYFDSSLPRPHPIICKPPRQ